jgi:hypothetical protein
MQVSALRALRRGSMMTPTPSTDPLTPPLHFRAFYEGPYRAEHAHPGNVRLHVLGTVAGLLFVPMALLSPWPWLVLLFPLVHAVPGLVGHRLFERSAQVGDLRVMRKDFSPLWFIAANHLLTLDRLRAALRRRG